MRIRLALLLSLISFLAASGIGMAAPNRDPAYAIAESAFQSTFNVEQRVFLQVLLIASGHLNSVPNENFNHRVYEAILRFQTESGFIATGVFDKVTAERLVAVSASMFDLWGFRTVSHPFRPISLPIPLGLGLVATRNEFGLHYEDPQHRIALDFTTVPNASAVRNYTALLDGYLSSGATINYKVPRETWFVISASLPNGIDSYARYHQDGANVTGFSLWWNNSNGVVSAERIAVLLSSSLWSTMTGAARVDLPKRRESAPPDTSSQVAATRPAPPPPPPKPAEPQISTGTAFFVTEDGALVTSEHVIQGCSKVAIKTSDGAILEVRIVAQDAANDLAILKADKTVLKVAALRIGVRLGEGVEAFGFPHADILSSSGNFTLGNVTALSGMGDDSRFIQMSAPVQAGNSGGPLLDQNGNLVGVVAAKLDALKVVLKDGDLPQNVNFAVKSAILATFLDSNRIAYLQGTDTKPMEPADIAEKARQMSAFVVCQ
jgi:serine protease Do